MQLAIEFGNTFTTIAYTGYGIVFREPTLVAVCEDNEKYTVKAFGEEAALLQGKTDEKTTIFSPLSSNKVISFEYASLYLKYCLEKTAKTLNKPFKKNTVFCVPLSLDAETRLVYEKLALTLGLPNFCFAPSIVLAALSLKTYPTDTNVQVVVDMGGGKCDIALIKQNEIFKGVSVLLGGKILDSQIMKLVEDNFNVQIGTLVARKLKEELASLYENDTAFLQVVGKNLVTGEVKKTEVFSKDIFPAVEDYFEKIANAISFFVAALPEELSKEIAKTGVAIIGGMAHVPGAKQFMSKKQKNKIILIDNFESCVMDGAEIAMKNPQILENISSNF